MSHYDSKEEEEADGSRMLRDGEDLMCCSILDSRRMMSLICVGNSISRGERKCQKVWMWGMLVRQSHFPRLYLLISGDEHARALEEQWIEGGLTADTATSTSSTNPFLTRADE